MANVIIAPSMLSSNFSCLAEELDSLRAAGLFWVHLDVMDGAFVPNITFGPPIIKAMRKCSAMFFDIHLMIERPERYITDFVAAGADLICVHAESTSYLELVCNMIAKTGKKIGVALNPTTLVETVKYVLPQLDIVLVMSVPPGFSGQSFMPFCLDKINELKMMIRACGAKTLIQVDGGVTLENCSDIVNAGADVLVSGSSFFNFPPYTERHQAFQRACLG